MKVLRPLDEFFDDPLDLVRLRDKKKKTIFDEVLKQTSSSLHNVSNLPSELLRLITGSSKGGSITLQGFNPSMPELPNLDELIASFSTIWEAFNSLPWPYKPEGETIMETAEVSGEWIEFPIYSAIASIVEQMGEDPIFPGSGSMKSDLEFILYAVKLGRRDPGMWIPTGVKFMGLELGYLYTDSTGNDVTVLGFILKWLMYGICIYILTLIFPFVSPGIITAAVLKIKPKRDLASEKLGDYRPEDGDTVMSHLNRIEGSLLNEGSIGKVFIDIIIPLLRKLHYV